MNRVLVIHEKLTPPFCCTVIWKLFWIFKKNYFIWHIWKHSRRGWEHHVCVSVQKSVCKEYRTHLQSSASGFFMPDQRHFLSLYSYSLKHRHTLLLWCTAYIICEHLQEMYTELKTLEWWISGLRLNPLFFSISRLNMACSPLIFNLQIN